MAIAFIVLFVLVGVAVFEVVGALWYGPLFGRLWARSLGKEHTRMGAKALAVMMAKMSVPYVFVSFMLLLVAFALPVLSMAIGVALVLVLFAAFVSLASYIYEKHSLWAWVIQYSYVATASVLTVSLQSWMLW